MRFRPVASARLSRRTLLASAALVPAGLAGTTLPRTVRASSPGGETVRIAVGGRSLLYYLPLMLAFWKGFFREEGVDVEIFDTTGGSPSLQAMIAGNADIVAGAFEHTLRLHRALSLQAFVLMDRTPQCVFAMNRLTMGGETDPSKLRWLRIGVTAQGSASHVFADFLMQRAGLQPGEYLIVDVGSGSEAARAVRTKAVDAVVGFDPVIGSLEREGIVSTIADTRSVGASDRLFGGPMVGACLYAPQVFLERRPTAVQGVTNAVARSLRLIGTVSAGDLLDVVPEEMLPPHPEDYVRCFEALRPAFSADGRFPQGCIEAALRMLSTISRQELPASDAFFTNRFVEKAVPG